MFDKTVAELSSALRAKKVSSLELTQVFLGRIARYKHLNAFITVDAERVHEFVAIGIRRENRSQYRRATRH